KSRLTSRISSGDVTDQKPASSGYSVILSVQCTGHSERKRLKTSWGGPSGQSSRSVRRRPSSVGLSSCAGASRSGAATGASLLREAGVSERRAVWQRGRAAAPRGRAVGNDPVLLLHSNS